MLLRPSIEGRATVPTQSSEQLAEALAEETSLRIIEVKTRTLGVLRRTRGWQTGCHGLLG